MGWDRASLTQRVVQSLHRDAWDKSAGRNGSYSPNISRTYQSGCRTVGLAGAVKQPPLNPSDGWHDGQQQSVGDDRRDVSSEADRLRFVTGYRSGDRRISAGRDLFSIGSQEDVIYNVLDGWVALYTLLEDGRKQIVQFALPGAVLGIFLSGGARATFGAEALTDLVVSVIPRGTLTSLVRSDPELGIRLAQSLARDCSLAFDHLTSIGRRLARERVAHLLLELFVRCRAQWPGSRIEEMFLPLTQEQIGDATGLTFVHVNRVLRMFRKERILEFHYRRLRILDPDRLVDVAGIDPQIAMSWIDGQPLRES